MIVFVVVDADYDVEFVNPLNIIELGSYSNYASHSLDILMQSIRAEDSEMYTDLTSDNAKLYKVVQIEVEYRAVSTYIQPPTGEYTMK